jgi:hypothetical protein
VIQSKKKKCPTCGKLDYLWNRKIGCKSCVANSNTITRKSKPIKKVSTTQKESNTKVKKAKAEVIKSQLDEYGYMFCSSCGTTEGVLNCSHLVPIGYNKKLEDNPLNIVIQCQEYCHPEWERLTAEIKEFRNIEDILERVKKLDVTYYNKVKSRLES